MAPIIYFKALILVFSKMRVSGEQYIWYYVLNCICKNYKFGFDQTIAQSNQKYVKSILNSITLTITSHCKTKLITQRRILLICM